MNSSHSFYLLGFSPKKVFQTIFIILYQPPFNPVLPAPYENEAINFETSVPLLHQPHPFISLVLSDMNNPFCLWLWFQSVDGTSHPFMQMALIF